jgi:Zn-dependent peptidase ImmA (M78 family)
LLGNDEPVPAVAARQGRTPAEQRSTSEAIERATDLARRRAGLEKLGYHHRPTRFARPSPSADPVVAGERLAHAALDYLGVESVSAINDNDLIDTIERNFAVDIAVEEFDGDFEGLTWRNDGVNVILVATSRVPGRRRFTLAHELAHLLAEDDHELFVDVARERERPLSEVRANAFAAGFLMPEQEVKAFLGSDDVTERSFAELAWKMQVTPRTLSYRLFNLNILDKQQLKQYGGIRTIDAVRTIGRGAIFSNWIKYSQQRRLPKLLVEHSWQAYLDGATTLRPFASLIGADVDSLREDLEARWSQPESFITDDVNDCAESSSKSSPPGRGTDPRVVAVVAFDGDDTLRRHSMQDTQPSTSVPSKAIWRRRM